MQWFDHPFECNIFLLVIMLFTVFHSFFYLVFVIIILNLSYVKYPVELKKNNKIHGLFYFKF